MRELRTAVGLSRSAIYDLVKAGQFPPPVKLGRQASAWPESEVSAWQRARIAERDAQGRPQRAARR